MKKVSFVLTAAVSVFMFAGCSAKGPSFKEFKQAEQGKSLIYVYRDDSFVGSGAYYDVHIKNGDKDTIIGTLKSNGYLEATTEPNKELEIWAKTEAKASLLLDVKPNQTYCVRGGMGMGFFVGHPKFEQVSLATCKEEIVKTKLSVGDEPKNK